MATDLISEEYKTILFFVFTSANLYLARGEEDGVERGLALRIVSGGCNVQEVRTEPRRTRQAIEQTVRLLRACGLHTQNRLSQAVCQRDERYLVWLVPRLLGALLRHGELSKGPCPVQVFVASRRLRPRGIGEPGLDFRRTFW
jgi:hypothetical protein